MMYMSVVDQPQSPSPLPSGEATRRLTADDAAASSCAQGPLPSSGESLGGCLSRKQAEPLMCAQKGWLLGGRCSTPPPPTFPPRDQYHVCHAGRRMAGPQVFSSPPTPSNETVWPMHVVSTSPTRCGIKAAWDRGESGSVEDGGKGWSGRARAGGRVPPSRTP